MWVAVSVIVTGDLLSWRFWYELGIDSESVSTTILSVGLLVGGVTAVFLAVWRNIVVERQADTAQERRRTP